MLNFSYSINSRIGKKRSVTKFQYRQSLEKSENHEEVCVSHLKNECGTTVWAFQETLVIICAYIFELIFIPMCHDDNAAIWALAYWKYNATCSGYLSLILAIELFNTVIFIAKQKGLWCCRCIICCVIYTPWLSCYTVYINIYVYSIYVHKTVMM